MARRLMGVAVVAAGVALLPPSAQALLGDSDGSFGLDGNLRTLTLLMDTDALVGADVDSIAMGQATLRLVAAGHAADWLSYELHLVQTLGFLSSPIGQDAAASPVGAALRSRYQAADVAWRWESGDQIAGLLYADRFNVKIALPFADITLGRQAISFGKAYFWNPLDVFFSFAATAFDRDYKGGVDALRVDLPLGDFSGLTGVVALGAAPGDDGEALLYRGGVLLRGFTNVADWDVAVQAGKVHGGLHVGGAAAGEVGPVALRLEGSYFWPLDELRPAGASALPDALSLVVGVGYHFESELQIEGEYLYNGYGRLPKTESMPLLDAGEIPHATEHLIGVMASYPLSPLLRGVFAVIVAPAEGAGLLQPGLTYSLADEVDLLAGAIISFGERPRFHRPTGTLVIPSELGRSPHLVYVELKAYF